MRSLAACLTVTVLLASTGCGGSRASLKQSLDRCLTKSGDLIVPVSQSSFQGLKQPRVVRSWEVVKRPTPPFVIDSKTKLQPSPHEVGLVAFMRDGSLARRYVKAWRAYFQRRVNGLPQSLTGAPATHVSDSAGSIMWVALSRWSEVKTVAACVSAASPHQP